MALSIIVQVLSCIKTGDVIAEGESIATLYASDESLLANAAKTYIEAITISEEMPKCSGYHS